MALNTEIDALLAEATAQGITVEQVLQQVFLRNQSENIADSFPALTFTDYLPVFPADGWGGMKSYLSTLTNTLPIDVAYSRAWSAFYTEDEILFLQCVFQLLRCFARDVQYNPAYPSYSTKVWNQTWGIAALSL